MIRFNFMCTHTVNRQLPGAVSGDTYLWQSKADDHDFAIVQFSGSGSRHHFTGENFWHCDLPELFIPEWMWLQTGEGYQKLDEGLQARFMLGSGSV